MGYIAPITWSTGTDITAARLNQDLRDNVAFLRTPPSCRVYNSANISITNATETTLTFNSERYDTDTMHSTGVNTGRITFTTAGKYHFGTNVEFASVVDGIRKVMIRLNGTTYVAQELQQTNTSYAHSMQAFGDYAFSAADYIEVRVYHEAGAALNVLATANISPEFWAHWISG